MISRAALLALVLAALALPAPPASAQMGCLFDGNPVPHGTRVGNRVCDNGQWVDG